MDREIYHHFFVMFFCSKEKSMMLPAYDDMKIMWRQPSLTTALSNLLVLVAVLVGGICGQVAAAETEARHLYVSPREGDDANEGTETAPLASIEEARNRVRKMIARGLESDVVVRLQWGIYSLQEPVEFGIADSPPAPYRVTYVGENRGDQRPIVTGGRMIEGWKVEDDGSWTTTVEAVRDGQWSFRQLFGMQTGKEQAKRLTRAREPDVGYYRVEKVGPDRRSSFTFAEDDLQRYENLDTVELVFLHDWCVSRTPIASLDVENRKVVFPYPIGGSNRWSAMDWFEKHPRYFVENAREMLDTPGEWFLDRDSGKLAYLPLPGQTLENMRFYAPAAKQLIVVRGDMASGKRARGLEFANLIMAGTAWETRNGVYWGRQAATYFIPEGKGPHFEADPAAIHFSLSENCTLRDIQATNIGASAIWLERDCKQCRIEGCQVNDIGANGIMIGEGQVRTVGDDQPWWSAAAEQASQGNRIVRCRVHDCGKLLYGSVGIWIGLASDTAVVGNEVYDQPYTGISVGWMWWNPRSRDKPRRTPCRENRVLGNHIHHIMQILSDGGGIYTLGIQPDSRLAWNHIHDIPLNMGRAESNGMFLDQGTGGFMIDENLIYNVVKSPFRFHKGWVNTVRQNTVKMADDVPLVRYNDTVESRITVMENRVVDSETELKKARKAFLEEQQAFLDKWEAENTF
jgi:hypothetical protein